MKPDFFILMFSKGVMQRASKVSLLVGTILALINHGDVLWVGGITTTVTVKILITFLVPYLVSAYSSVRAIQSGQ